MLSATELKRWMRSVGGPAFRSLPPPSAITSGAAGRCRPPMSMCPPGKDNVCSRLSSKGYTLDPGPPCGFCPGRRGLVMRFQRPQQMARALAEIGCTVIYYEPWQFEADFTSQEGPPRDASLACGILLRACIVALSSGFVAGLSGHVST